MRRSAALVGKIFYLRQGAVASAGAAARVVREESSRSYPSTFLGGRLDRLGDEKMKRHCPAFLKI